MDESLRPIMKKIEAEQPCVVPEKSQTLTLAVRPTTPTLPMPRANGVNILQTANDMQTLREKLANCGITIVRSLHFVYSDGTTRPRLLYCSTIHGQYVIVEPPEGLISYGDLSILEQRVGVLPDNILEQVEAALRNIHTGYAYISGGGIHYRSNKHAEPKFFGYENYKQAKALLDVRKWNYHLIPAVHWTQLIEPARLNTIEAHISSVLAASPLDQAVRKADLLTLLTTSGPLTFFAPSDKILSEQLLKLSPEKLRVVLLAHLVPERLARGDPSKAAPRLGNPQATNGLTPAEEVSSLGTEKATWSALAQNEFEVHRLNGSVVGLLPLEGKVANSNLKIRVVGEGIQKYNGVLYRIDGILTPVAQSVNVPTVSDLDNVVTVFDINRTTMEIRLAQYQLNQRQIFQMSKMLEFVQTSAAVINTEITEKSNREGVQLIRDSNTMVGLFFTREVPCATLCAELDQLAEKVKAENLKYEKFLRAGNRLSSLKYKVEKIMLKLARIDQQLHVEDPISTVSDLEEL